MYHATHHLPPSALPALLLPTVYSNGALYRAAARRDIPRAGHLRASCILLFNPKCILRYCKLNGDLIARLKQRASSSTRVETPRTRTWEEDTKPGKI